MKKRNFKWWIALPATIATLPLIAAACDNGKAKDNPINPGDGMKPTPDKPGDGMMPKPDKPKDMAMMPNTPAPGDKPKDMVPKDMGIKPQEPAPMMPEKPEDMGIKPQEPAPMMPEKPEDMGMKPQEPAPMMPEKPEDMGMKPQEPAPMMPENPEDMGMKPQEPAPMMPEKPEDMGNNSGMPMQETPKNMENNEQSMMHNVPNDMNKDEIAEIKNKIKMYLEKYFVTTDQEYKKFISALEGVASLEDSKNLENEVITSIKMTLKAKVKAIIDHGVFEEKEKLVKELDSLTIEKLREKEISYPLKSLENFIDGLKNKDMPKYQKFLEIVKKAKTKEELKEISEYYKEELKKLRALIKQYNLDNTFKNEINSINSFGKIYKLTDSVNDLVSKLKKVQDIVVVPGSGFKFNLENRVIDKDDIIQIAIKIVDIKGITNAGSIREQQVTYDPNAQQKYEIKFLRKKQKENISKIYFYGVSIYNTRTKNRDNYLMPNLSLVESLKIQETMNFNPAEYPNLTNVEI
ncbi:hypothetical protein HGG64_01690 [Mycoplasma phocoeninasale]|uniref:Lipoprotein n=1 Tax=Mycoplasma phocoeninasale TaxID=2726117 RepID=A0A858U2Z9_9MOLU|nr:hypothetical protein [Mycoplasma phocoeninasale]QJG66419.1 hypothetical protein HGG64_01690 [Mycoplasma phocoeninasale]